MDPEANLEEQRQLVKSINKARDNEQDVDQEDIWRLAELVEALDDWIRCGGFLPKDWLHGAQSDGPDIELDESEAP